MLASEVQLPYVVSVSPDTLSYALPAGLIVREGAHLSLLLEDGASEEVVFEPQLSTHYTVSVTNAGTATITFLNNTQLLSGRKLVVDRRTPRTQPVNFKELEALPGPAIELQGDRQAMIAQELDQKLSRALLARRGESLPAFPAKAALAGRLAWLNTAGTGWNTMSGEGFAALAEDLAQGVSSAVLALAARTDALDELQGIQVEMLALAMIAANIVAVSQLDAGDLAGIAGGLAAKIDTAGGDASAAVVTVPYGTAARSLGNLIGEEISPLSFGASGNGSDDDTSAVLAAAARVNLVGGALRIEAGRRYRFTSPIELTANGACIRGAAAGNVSNLFPALPGPSVLIYEGDGEAIRVKGQGCQLEGFRLTAGGARATDTFDLQKPGIRVETVDTTGEAGRADRCIIRDVRIDKQPGDGVLMVGPVTFFGLYDVDVYECRGFGVRADDGSLTGLVRTNKHYPGLLDIDRMRVGFCGGHALAVSNSTVTTQDGMGIRCQVRQLDTFGNGNNTAIMYPSADGKYYTVWIFGENCEIKNSAPDGRTWDGSAFVSEQRGGVWIAGRDNYLINNRYIETSQPIYWGHKTEQPSYGLVVDGVRLTQTSLVHSQLVQLQSSAARGLFIRAHDKGIGGDMFTRFAGPQTNMAAVGHVIEYRGQNNLINRASSVSIADDAVAVIPIVGAAASATQQFVLALAGTAVSSGGGIFHCRAGSASPAVNKWSGESNTVGRPGGGPLTGTTGTDGEVTVSCDDTSLYIENRRGFAITVNYQLQALNGNSGLLA